MSTLRYRFISMMVVLPGMFAGSVSAQDTDNVQELRNWAADVIKGETTAAGESFNATNSETTNSLSSRILNKGHGFLAQVGGLIDQRIGWLRPTTVKEQSLIWLAFAMALPWGFVSWIRPILSKDLAIVRILVVTAWSGISMWLAWRTWGEPSGADKFASTMLIGVPVLWIYFNTVVRSIAVPTKA